MNFRCFNEAFPIFIIPPIVARVSVGFSDFAL